MTKVTISGNSNGNGNVNFAAPNTNSAITVTLPSSNVDMDNLGPSTTALDVGTYAYLFNDGASGTNDYSIGQDAPGSLLMWKNGYFVSGTWRSMGNGTARTGEKLWLRIT